METKKRKEKSEGKERDAFFCERRTKVEGQEREKKKEGRCWTFRTSRKGTEKGKEREEKGKGRELGEIHTKGAVLGTGEKRTKGGLRNSRNLDRNHKKFFGERRNKVGEEWTVGEGIFHSENRRVANLKK